MESMKEILESMAEEDKDTRSVRLHIEHQISTKMYEQHLPNLGRLTDDEITAVMSFYRRMKSILESHQKYNEAKKAETPENKEKRKEQSRQEWFSSYSIHVTAQKALEDLSAAQDARKEVNFWQYILS
jgi:hypothetical protein